MEVGPTPTLPVAWTDDAPACTLPTAERPLRQAAFDELFAETLIGVRRPSVDHAVLVLAGPAGTEGEVRDLAARESSCCSFFEFTVAPDRSSNAADVVTLDVRVPGVHVAVLDALILRAQAAADRSDA